MGTACLVLCPFHSPSCVTPPALLSYGTCWKIGLFFWVPDGGKSPNRLRGRWGRCHPVIMCLFSFPHSDICDLWAHPSGEECVCVHARLGLCVVEVILWDDGEKKVFLPLHCPPLWAPRRKMGSPLMLGRRQCGNLTADSIFWQTLWLMR